MTQVKFRGIFLEEFESSEHNWADISGTMLMFWQLGLLDVVLSEYPDKSYNFTKGARLISQSGIYYIFTNISEGRAFPLQGLIYIYSRLLNQPCFFCLI